MQTCKKSTPTRRSFQRVVHTATWRFQSKRLSKRLFYCLFANTLAVYNKIPYFYSINSNPTDEFFNQAKPGDKCRVPQMVFEIHGIHDIEDFELWHRLNLNMN